MIKTLSLLLLGLILLSGCGLAGAVGGANPPAPAATATLPAVSEADAPAEQAAPAQPATAPLASPTKLSTATTSPTTAPSETPTLTPTPTPFPMSIEALRAQEQAGAFPGSQITIERELDAGQNYHRYYASYLSQGLKIYALLTVPNGDPPEGGWPAIVFNHGYIPPQVYRTTERYVAYVDWLARSGYIVFRIDYRGNDQSEGQALGAYGDPGYTADVLNAIASIKQFPQANPNKIGMWGHSMGGYLTLRAMVISPDVKAGVIWSGVVASYPDMLYHWRRVGPTPTPQPTSRRWRQDWIKQYGTPEQNPAFWASVSANSYLQDLSGPLQLHHATTDEEVPVEWSQTLNQQVQDAGKSVELYTYEGDNHNLSASFATAMTRTIEFFDRYLK